MKISEKNWMIAGGAPRPTIQRQPDGNVEKSQPIRYATTWPPATKVMDTVTRRPRRWLGDNSAMYRGTIKAAPPIANPTALRPSIIPHTVVVTACHDGPKVQRTSAM